MERLAGTPLRRLVAVALFAVCGFAAPAPVQAVWPQPVMSAVFPLGGQPGKEVEVTVAGTDLDDARLVFSHPGITSTPVTADPKPYQTERPVVANRFKVTIPADCPPGLYDVRTVGRFGASNPRTFIVDPAPDVLEVEPNNEVAQAQEIPLNGVVNGKAETRGFDYFKFHAKPGERVLIDLWADRLDTLLDGTLVLLDATGRELARSRDAAGLDPLIDFSPTAEGDYFIRLYDFTYKGDDNYGYRLSVGAAPHIDFVLPPLVPTSGPGVVAVYGRNLPDAQPAPGVTIDGRPLDVQQRTVQLGVGDLAGAALDAFVSPGVVVDPSRSSVNVFEFRLTSPGGLSNPIAVEATDLPIVLENETPETPNAPQTVPVPCVVGGRFFPVGDQDVYAFEAKKGEVLWIEVASQRLGAEVDPMFVVQRVVKTPEGAESLQDVATADDPAASPAGTIIESGSDPSLLFTAPEDGQYRVLVRDLFSRLQPDPRCVYRLTVRPPQPSFRLIAFPRNPANVAPNYSAFSTNVRPGGTIALDVLAYRLEGFGGAPVAAGQRRGRRAMQAAPANPNDTSGEIELTVEGLPEFLTAAPVVIGPGRPSAMIVITAKENATDWYGEIRIRGKAEVNGQPVERLAAAAAVTWNAAQNSQIGSTRLTRGLPVCVIGREPAPYSVEIDASKPWEVSRAGKLELPLKVARRNEFAGAIALTAINAPQGVQIPAVTIPGDKSEGTLTVTVPPAAALGRYTVHLHGASTHKYVRHAESVAHAKAEQEAVVKYLAEQQELAKKANEAKAAADKGVPAAQEAVKQATAKAAEAKKAADAAPDDAAKKTEAEADAKTQADAEAALKTAQETKTAADAAATAAAASVKQAEQFKQQADQVVTQVAKNGQPADLALIEPSTPLTFEVIAAPLDLEATEATVAVGEKGEATVKFARLLDFAEVVSLTVNLPNGVGGINIPKVDAPKDQSEAKLAIDATAKAPPGVHAATVRATVQYNGQSLTLDAPFTLTIAGPKDPPAK